MHPTAIYTLSLHDALPIWVRDLDRQRRDLDERIAAGHHQVDSRQGVERPRDRRVGRLRRRARRLADLVADPPRSEEHTSELQSLRHLVCRLLLEKKKKNRI